MKSEQEKLYKHYKGIAENKIKSKGGKDFPKKVRENCKKYAEEISKSFPEFKKETKPEQK